MLLLHSKTIELCSLNLRLNPQKFAKVEHIPLLHRQIDPPLRRQRESHWMLQKLHSLLQLRQKFRLSDFKKTKGRRAAA